jgi:hypothetical protein
MNTTNRLASVTTSVSSGVEKIDDDDAVISGKDYFVRAKIGNGLNYRKPHIRHKSRERGGVVGGHQFEDGKSCIC